MASEIDLKTVEIDRETDGRWIAEIPSIPGALAYGATEVEARCAAMTIAAEVLAARLAALSSAITEAELKRVVFAERGYPESACLALAALARSEIAAPPMHRGAVVPPAVHVEDEARVPLQGYHVRRWGPREDGHPTQVRIALKQGGTFIPFEFRFETRRSISEFLRQVARARDKIWPSPARMAAAVREKEAKKHGHKANDGEKEIGAQAGSAQDGSQAAPLVD